MPRVREPAALAAMAATARGILSGAAEGKIKNVYERAGLAGALGVMAGTPLRGPAVATLAAETTELLATFYKCAVWGLSWVLEVS